MSFFQSFDMTFLGGQSEKRWFHLLWIPLLPVSQCSDLYYAVHLAGCEKEWASVCRSNFNLLFYNISSNSSYPEKSFLESFLKANYISYTEMHVTMMKKS